MFISCEFRVSLILWLMNTNDGWEPLKCSMLSVTQGIKNLFSSWADCSLTDRYLQTTLKGNYVFLLIWTCHSGCLIVNIHANDWIMDVEQGARCEKRKNQVTRHRRRRIKHRCFAGKNSNLLPNPIHSSQQCILHIKPCWSSTNNNNNNKHQEHIMVEFSSATDEQTCHSLLDINFNLKALCPHTVCSSDDHTITACSCLCDECVRVLCLHWACLSELYVVISILISAERQAIKWLKCFENTLKRPDRTHSASSDWCRITRCISSTVGFAPDCCGWRAEQAGNASALLDNPCFTPNLLTRDRVRARINVAALGFLC